MFNALSTLDFHSPFLIIRFLIIVPIECCFVLGLQTEWTSAISELLLDPQKLLLSTLLLLKLKSSCIWDSLKMPLWIQHFDGFGVLRHVFDNWLVVHELLQQLDWNIGLVHSLQSVKASHILTLSEVDLWPVPSWELSSCHRRYSSDPIRGLGPIGDWRRHWHV